MKRILFVIFALFAIHAAAIAQSLPVTFQWDASATPSATDNPIKYRLCTSVTNPTTWPAGGLPADRVCEDAGTLLEWKLSMAVGVKFVFATARNFGLSSDGVPNPAYEQESGPSNVLRVEVFAPPGRPDKIRIKSVTQAMDTTSGQIMSARKAVD